MLKKLIMSWSNNIKVLYLLSATELRMTLMRVSDIFGSEEGIMLEDSSHYSKCLKKLYLKFYSTDPVYPDLFYKDLFIY